MKRLLAGMMMAAGIYGVAAAAQRAGAAAQDFTLPVLEQKGGVQLASLKGKVVLVDFWATWCEPCKRELPELEKLAREMAGRGVVVLAINLDKERNAAQEMARRLGLSAVRVLWDPEGKVAERYDPPKMPTSYVVDRTGVVRFVHEGFEGAKDVARLRKELETLTR
jgi:peroxiredoxin